jgi:ectoine hydroxylase-related dioxygenase (phytanoyl-CoA dioxygenase family)
MLRNGLDKAISHWHVDSNVEFPLPPDVPRHDPRIQVPVLWMTFQIALTDIDSEENGPTQFVPTSHYSGRLPYAPDKPEFEGHGPVSLLCKAGDMYLTNHQTWHRGAPNRSSRTRYVLQMQYAMGWSMIRFNNSDTRALVDDLHTDGTSAEVRAQLRPLMATAWPA